MLARIKATPRQAADLGHLTPAQVVSLWAKVVEDPDVKRPAAVMAHRAAEGDVPPLDRDGLLAAIRAGIVRAIDGQPVDKAATWTHNSGGVYLDGRLLLATDRMQEASYA